MENDTNVHGWGVGLSAILGGALDYQAGRSTNQPFGYPGTFAAPGVAAVPSYTVNDNSHCRTCYQEGVQSGQTQAGLSYIGQRVAANANDIASAVSSLSSQMTSQYNAIQNQFNAQMQQKIADQAAEIAALRTQNIVGLTASQTNASLSAITDRLNALTAGCAVRAVPACPPNPCSCGVNA